MKKKFLLLAMIAILSLSFVTVLSACNKQEETGPVKLETPDDFDYDGTNITWAGSKVANVRYEVVTNEDDPVTRTAPSHSYKAGEDGSFTVSVTAKAPEGSEEYLDSDTVTKTFYKITAVENIQFTEDATMTWDPVANATGYKVEYNGTNSKVSECTFNNLPAGNYIVKVKAIRESEPDHVYYTENPLSNSITVLESVINDRITYVDGQIKWNNITRAVNYRVWIDDSDQGIVPTNSMTYDSQNQTFTVKVLALGNPDQKIFNARETASRIFKYLAPATNLVMEDGILTWDAVKDADGYEIKIGNGSPKDIGKDPVYDKFTPGTTTTLRIRAYSKDNTYYAGWTEEYSFYLLKSPVLKWTDKELDGAYGEPVSWDKIENATGYLAEIKGPTDDYNKIDELGFDGVGYGSDFLQVGTYTIRVKALADTNNACNSKWSEPITVVRLAAPQRTAGQSIKSDPNDMTKGFTVTFGNVAEASGYRLYKNDHPSRTNDDGKPQITDYMNDTGNEGDTATFALQSIGKAYNSATRKRVLDSLRSEKDAFTITVLATPSITTTPIEGMKYRFGEVDGTSKYTIAKDGAYDPVSHTDEGYDLSDLKGGQSYNIQVNARGNESDVLSSKYTAVTTVFRLSAPDNIRILTDQGSAGILKFDVGNAFAESFEYTIDGVKYELDKSGSDNIADKIGTDTKLFMKSIGGVYKNGTYYMDSPDSATKNFTKLQTPAISTNKKMTGTKIVWTKISNYAQYSPKYRVVRGSDGAVIGNNIDVGEFDIDDRLDGGTSETYYIYAIGNGTTYINSDKPDQGIEIERLATPEVTIDTTEMAYKWNVVENAKEYQVYVDGTREQTIQSNANTDVYYYRPTFTKVKQEGYAVRIVAVGNNEDGLMDSKAFTKTQKTQQLTSPSLTYDNISYDKEFVSEDGNINVNITAVNGALGYAYVVKGTEVRKTEHYYGAAHEYSASEVLTYSYNAKSSGDFEIYVYALGGKFIKDTNGDDVFTVNSRPTQSMTVTLLGYPSDLYTDDFQNLNWVRINGATGYNVEITLKGVKYPPASVKTNKVKLTDVIGDAYQKGASLSIRIQATSPNTYVINSAWYEQEIIAP